MNTFSDLKRELQVGKSLTLVEAPKNLKHRFLNVKRYIVKTQSNGVYLNEDKTAVKGSFLDLPRASLCEYDGTNIKVYEPAYRPLNEQEQAVLNNKPSRRAENKQLLENDLMCDGSTTYYMDKEYLKQHNMNYLMGSEERGLYYMNGTIRDASIKGELVLHYKLLKSE